MIGKFLPSYSSRLFFFYFSVLSWPVQPQLLCCHLGFLWLFKTFKTERKDTRLPLGQDMVTDLVWVFFKSWYGKNQLFILVSFSKGHRLFALQESGSALLVLLPSPQTVFYKVRVWLLV